MARRRQRGRDRSGRPRRDRHATSMAKQQAADDQLVRDLTDKMMTTRAKDPGITLTDLDKAFDICKAALPKPATIKVGDHVVVIEHHVLLIAEKWRGTDMEELTRLPWAKVHWLTDETPGIYVMAKPPELSDVSDILLKGLPESVKHNPIKENPDGLES